MTTLLASFGPAKSDSAWTQECLSVAGFDKIKNLIAGDIAGVPVPKDDSVLTRKAIDQYSKRLLGLSNQHIEECAERARHRESPSHQGVILLGMGRERSYCLRRICQLGWASILIIDSELAEALAAER